MYLYFNNKNKMPKKVQKNLFYKKESERTKTEKLIRDLVCYGVVIYAAVLGFLLVNANVNLTNAQTQLVNSQIAAQVQHAVE